MGGRAAASALLANESSPGWRGDSDVGSAEGSLGRKFWRIALSVASRRNASVGLKSRKAIWWTMLINGSLAFSPRGTLNFPLPPRVPKLPLAPARGAWSSSELGRRASRSKFGSERDAPAMAFERKEAFTAA